MGTGAIFREAAARAGAPPAVGEFAGRLSDIQDEVLRECARQVAKWGVQSHDHRTWLAILGEEYGEVARAVCEIALAGRGAYTASNLREELVHVAAVAVAAAECLDRCGFDGT